MSHKGNAKFTANRRNVGRGPNTRQGTPTYASQDDSSERRGGGRGGGYNGRRNGPPRGGRGGGRGGPRHDRDGPRYDNRQEREFVCNVKLTFAVDSALIEKAGTSGRAHDEVTVLRLNRTPYGKDGLPGGVRMTIPNIGQEQFLNVLQEFECQSDDDTVTIEGIVKSLSELQNLINRAARFATPEATHQIQYNEGEFDLPEEDDPDYLNCFPLELTLDAPLSPAQETSLQSTSWIYSVRVNDNRTMVRLAITPNYDLFTLYMPSVKPFSRDRREHAGGTSTFGLTTRKDEGDPEEWQASTSDLFTWQKTLTSAVKRLLNPPMNHTAFNEKDWGFVQEALSVLCGRNYVRKPQLNGSCPDKSKELVATVLDDKSITGKHTEVEYYAAANLMTPHIAGALAPFLARDKEGNPMLTSDRFAMFNALKSGGAFPRHYEKVFQLGGKLHKMNDICASPAQRVTEKLAPSTGKACFDQNVKVFYALQTLADINYRYTDIVSCNVESRQAEAEYDDVEEDEVPEDTEAVEVHLNVVVTDAEAVEATVA